MINGDHIGRAICKWLNIIVNRYALREKSMYSFASSASYFETDVQWFDIQFVFDGVQTMRVIDIIVL